jgi:two-component system, LytTR family, response regulator
MEHQIRALIVEDVEAYIQTIEKLVRDVAPEVLIVGKASSLATAQKMIRELAPDLLFLDIQFEEEGATAFDLLSQMQHKEELPFRIIFITAHLEASYYAEAFHYGALHFLEKPIDKSKLKEAIERAAGDKQPTGNQTWKEQLTLLQRHISAIRFPGKIIVEGTKFNEVIEIEDIILLEASGRYTEITLAEGKNIVACQNLGEFEKKLQNYPVFCRIHHNKIINLNFVKRFSKKERIIELDNPYGNHISSKERFREFLKMFEQGG